MVYVARNILENAGDDNISPGDILLRTAQGLGAPYGGEQGLAARDHPTPQPEVGTGAGAPGQPHPWESGTSLGKDRMGAHLGRAGQGCWELQTSPAAASLGKGL